MSVGRIIHNKIVDGLLAEIDFAGGVLPKKAFDRSWAICTQCEHFAHIHLPNGYITGLKKAIQIVHELLGETDNGV
ncbi:MAG TPA: hypothetical protein ENI27_05500 [bacterium]|nr:hypothetical protein [bacterium]